MELADDDVDDDGDNDDDDEVGECGLSRSSPEREIPDELRVNSGSSGISSDGVWMFVDCGIVVFYSAQCDKEAVASFEN